MENIKETYRRYIEIKKEISLLDAESKSLAPLIIKEMEEQKKDSIDGSTGKITLAERISFKYSPKVVAKKEELKVLQTSEEESGIAEMKTTKYLRATINKE